MAKGNRESEPPGAHMDKGRAQGVGRATCVGAKTGGSWVGGPELVILARW